SATSTLASDSTVRSTSSACGGRSGQCWERTKRCARSTRSPRTGASSRRCSMRSSRSSCGTAPHAVEELVLAAQRPFALDREIPLRLALLAQGPESALLYLRAHHVALDGTSSSVLFRDLSVAYARDDGRIEPPKAQYPDFAVWQAEYLASDAFRAAREYWRQRFRGSAGPTTIAPDVRPTVGADGLVGQRLEATVDPDLARSIRATAKVHDATPFVVFTAALLVLLYEET